jgi:Putative Ig domain
MDRVTFRRTRALGAYALCALAVTVLVGCGGGGGGDASSNSAVQSGAAAPTISGTPSTQATVGQAYSFTPSASGPSGTTLSFSIQNMPSWASFSIATGALTGTPSSADVETFSDIVISVSDGTQSTALTAFNIQVNAQAAGSGSGSATLAWVPPTTNTNGTPLTDLAGYVISYGTSPNALTETIKVTSATATGYTVQNLAAGTWYFTVAAYTSEGTQSAPSDTASTTIT